MGNVMKKNPIMLAIFEMFKLTMGVTKMVFLSIFFLQLYIYIKKKKKKIGEYTLLNAVYESHNVLLLVFPFKY